MNYFISSYGEFCPKPQLSNYHSRSYTKDIFYLWMSGLITEKQNSQLINLKDMLNRRIIQNHSQTAAKSATQWSSLEEECEA